MPKLPALRHRRNDPSETVPVVLRHVVITVDITGRLGVGSGSPAGASGSSRSGSAGGGGSPLTSLLWAELA